MPSSQRSIVAVLRAEANQFISTMTRAKKATESVGEGAEKASKQADSSFVKMRKSVQDNSQHIDRLGNTALIAGGAIAAGLGVGIKSFADFDEAMSQVRAALPDAGAKMDDLRQLAIDLGRDTQYSATEAAQGVTELAKAGVSAEDILGGGLAGALNLAAAGQMDVADAAETAATAMVQFGLKGNQVSHVADLLAAGAGKAQGDVADMGAALKQAGLVADQTGLTIEETTAGLTAFAAAGLVGSDAGTSFKAMLQRLTPQSKEAERKMAELGISAYDAQGQFIGLSEFSGNLRESLKDLTPEARNSALAVIFGSDAVRAANVLYEQGADGISKWETEVNSAGFAAQQAATKTDNLKGDLERLGGAIDSVFVENGSGANSALRSLTQRAEDAVEAFGKLPEPVQQGAFAVAGLSAAGLLLAGGFAKAVTTAADLSESFDVIRAKSPRAAKSLDVGTKAAKGLGAALATLSALAVVSSFGDRDTLGVEQLTNDLTGAADVVDEFNARIESLEPPVTAGGKAISNFDDVLHAAFDPSIAQDIDNIGFSILEAVGGTNASAIAQANDRFAELDATLSGLVASGQADEAARQFQQFADYARIAGGVTEEQFKTKVPQYTESLAALANQQKDTAGATEDNTATVVDLGEAAGGATEDIKDLADAIRGFGSEALNADEAEAAFQKAIDDATKSLEDNGASLKMRNGELVLSSEKARNNFDVLQSLTQSVKDNSAATLEQTGSVEDARAEMERGRKKFIEVADQMGLTRGQAKRLADQYGLIPGNVTTVVKAQGAESARRSVQDLINTVSRLNSKSITVGVRYTYSGTRPGGGRSLGGGITIDADGGLHVNGPAGLVKAYAGGGMWDGSFATAQPQVRPAGGRGVLWAEEGAGPWEAFVSGHPARRERSRSITEDVAARLGGRVEWARPFADGGVLTRSLTAAVASGVGAGSGPFEVFGTLDLGDGIRGVVRGELRTAARAAQRSRG